MSEIYSRQNELDLSIPYKVGIIGCGGIGTWIGIYSAMGGVKNLYLFDDDIIEISNLNRLPYPSSIIGTKKVNALKKFILSIRPETTVVAIPRRIRPETSVLLKDCQIVFDTTDSSKAHRIIESLWKRMSFTLIRASYDGEHVTVAKNYKLCEVTWGDEDQEGYTIVPSWVIPASFIAQIACWLAYSEQSPSSYLLNMNMGDILQIWRTTNDRKWRIEEFEKED